jgi:hypothetical protein
VKFFKFGWAAVLAVCAFPVHGTSLFISPTFNSSITSDPNAAVIESTINTALSIYAASFADPITVDITFGEGSGLGSSSTFFETVSYSTYCNALVADAKTGNDALAVATLAPGGVCPTHNPVTGSTMIDVKTANLRALGIATPGFGPGGAADGTVTLNTAITTPPGGGGFSLLAVTEHEIDEVLGLGSGLPNTAGPNIASSSIFPEDLFRFDASGNRTFASGASCTGLPNAFFSINGAVDLAQFNNACNGGDFGDWAVVGSPKVQDFAAISGSNPSLGPELIALDVIGYDSAVPEPATFLLVGAALVGAGLLKRRSNKP